MYFDWGKRKFRLIGFYPFLLLIGGLLLITSCIPQKRVIYMQDKSGSKATSGEFNNLQHQYKIRPGDELYIQVEGLDEKTATFFKTESAIGGGQIAGSMYMLSNTVTDKGILNYPSFGEIPVAGKSIFEIQKLLQDSLRNYVNFGTISVKMSNFRVGVLGEVGSPGTVTIQDEYATIFDVIALSGDLTSYGNRNKIAIIRITDNGTRYEEIDLTDRNILSSPYYYVYPGDLVYVPQMASKPFGLASFQLGSWLSLITSIISTGTLILYLTQREK